MKYKIWVLGIAVYKFWKLIYFFGREENGNFAVEPVGVSSALADLRQQEPEPGLVSRKPGWQLLWVGVQRTGLHSLYVP